MKLSVIVPVYNVAAYLPDCLRSLQQQNVDDMEVILVDDGSTDNSGALCDEIAAADPRFCVIHQRNGGLSAARNAGLDNATGDFISFVDSDDRLGSNSLRGNLRLFEANPSPDLIEYPVRIYEGSPQEHLLSFDDATITSSSRTSVFADWIQRRGYEHCYAWNKIYRASLWASRRFPQGQLFEDTAVMPDIIRQCKAIRYSSRGCYHYMSRQHSISRTWHYADCRQLFLNNWKLLSEASSLPHVRSSLRNLRRSCLNRLVDMGRCKDCNYADYSRQLAKISSIERFICRWRVLTSSKL
ncbi:MAG: glycosyltransferase family 2 protein [Bacteroidaceae bacterium]|nr:glycosyltransferase family 2 protein [Bacteroidaceae bacterium]